MNDAPGRPAPPAPTAAGLGFAALFAVAIGVIVAQSTIVSLLQAVGIAGWGFAGAMVVGWLLMMCNSATYAELALMMPRATGISAYIGAGLGPLPAIFAVFAGYVVPALFGPAAELLLVDAVLEQLLPGALPAFGWAALLLGVLVVLNLLGTDVFARVQTALTFTMLVFLALTAAWAFAGTPASGAAPQGFAGMGEQVTVFGVVALVMYSLIGTEFVTPLTGAARNAPRDLPRAMFTGLTVVALANLAFCLGAAYVLGRAKLAESPLPHLDVVVAVFGPGVRIVFAAIVITATASLLNTVLAAVPRMLMEMAHAGEAFPQFKHVNRFGVPWVATLFVAALPLAGLAWSGGDVARIVPLLVAAASAWLVSYMVAHAALIALRRRAPDVPRPWRSPFAPWPQLAAIAGLAYVVAHAAPAPELEGPVFAALAVVLGLVAGIGALWVALVMRRRMFAPAD
jgi:amino acid transporter